MNKLLAQVDELTAFQHAVRKEFEEGWSLNGTLLTVGFVVTLIVVTYILVRRQERQHRGDPPRRPIKLFRDLLDHLSLGGAEKQLLQSVAHRNQLANPTVLLLSPALFDRHTARYLAQRPVDIPKTRLSVEVELIARLREELFPGAS